MLRADRDIIYVKLADIESNQEISVQIGSDYFWTCPHTRFRCMTKPSRASDPRFCFRFRAPEFLKKVQWGGAMVSRSTCNRKVPGSILGGVTSALLFWQGGGKETCAQSSEHSCSQLSVHPAKHSPPGVLCQRVKRSLFLLTQSF